MNHWFASYLYMNLTVLAVLLFTSMSLTSNMTWSKSSYQEINQLISAWQTTEARQAFDQLENDNRGKITHELVRGRLLLFEGNYTDSVAAFDLVKSKDPQALSVMGSVVQQAYDTHEALKGMQELYHYRY